MAGDDSNLMPPDGDKHQATAGGAASDAGTCPDCGCAMEPGAVVCIECGFHIEQGARVQASPRPKKKRKKKLRLKLSLDPRIAIGLGMTGMFAVAVLCVVLSPRVVFGWIASGLFWLGLSGIGLGVAWIVLRLMINDPLRAFVGLFMLGVGWRIRPELEFEEHYQIQAPIQLILWSCLVIGSAIPFAVVANLF